MHLIDDYWRRVAAKEALRLFFGLLGFGREVKGYEFMVREESSKGRGLAFVAEGTAAAIGGRDTARTRIRFTLPAGYADADLAQGLPGTAGQGIRLSSRARATASVLLAAPSLPRTWLTCFLTVSRVTTSSRAMA